MERYLKLAVRLLFRADAAFAKPELYEYMEARRIGYAIRLPASAGNSAPVGTAYRVAFPIMTRLPSSELGCSSEGDAKVEWHQGELFPRVGFIVTNLSYPTKGIVSFYNGRGTAEQWVRRQIRTELDEAVVS